MDEQRIGYNLEEVAELIGVAHHRLAYARKEGKLPKPLSAGRSKLFTRSQVKEIAAMFGVEVPPVIARLSETDTRKAVSQDPGIALIFAGLDGLMPYLKDGMRLDVDVAGNRYVVALDGSDLLIKRKESAK